MQTNRKTPKPKPNHHLQSKNSKWRKTCFVTSLHWICGKKYYIVWHCVSGNLPLMFAKIIQFKLLFFPSGCDNFILFIGVKGLCLHIFWFCDSMTMSPYCLISLLCSPEGKDIYYMVLISFFILYCIAHWPGDVSINKLNVMRRGKKELWGTWFQTEIFWIKL